MAVAQDEVAAGNIQSIPTRRARGLSSESFRDHHDFRQVATGRKEPQALGPTEARGTSGTHAHERRKTHEGDKPDKARQRVRFPHAKIEK